MNEQYGHDFIMRPGEPDEEEPVSNEHPVQRLIEAARNMTQTMEKCFGLQKQTGMWSALVAAEAWMKEQKSVAAKALEDLREWVRQIHDETPNREWFGYDEHRAGIRLTCKSVAKEIDAQLAKLTEDTERRGNDGTIR